MLQLSGCSWRSLIASPIPKSSNRHWCPSPSRWIPRRSNYPTPDLSRRQSPLESQLYHDPGFYWDSFLEFCGLAALPPFCNVLSASLSYVVPIWTGPFLLPSRPSPHCTPLTTPSLTPLLFHIRTYILDNHSYKIMWYMACSCLIFLVLGETRF